MKRIIILLGIFLILINGFSQLKINEVLKPRKSFISIKDYHEKTPKNNWVILSNDTLVEVTKDNIDLSHLYNDTDKRRKIINSYQWNVFANSNENSKQIRYLYQWNTPIAVYFDKKIPKDIVDKIKFFFQILMSQT